MLDRENYVARLRALILAIGPQHDESVETALSRGLGVRAGTAEFFDGVVRIMELFSRAKEQVGELAGVPNRALYLEVMAELSTVFERFELADNWSRHREKLSPRNLALLQACEGDVAHRLTTQEPTQDQLDEALQDVRFAIEDVEAADSIEADVRQLLLEMLRDVERALVAYKLSGLAGIRRAAERTLGLLYLNRELVERARKQAPSVVLRVYTAVTAVLAFLKTMDIASQLPGKGTAALEALRQLIQQSGQ